MPKEAASLKLCRASAIKDKLPEMIPPTNCAIVNIRLIETAPINRPSLESGE